MMNQARILEDYFLISVEPNTQTSAYLLLSQTGVLFSGDCLHRLIITDIQIAPPRNQEAYIFLKASAEIQDISGTKNFVIETLEAVGSFSQIYNYLANQFERFCRENEQSILLFEVRNDA